MDMSEAPKEKKKKKKEKKVDIEDMYSFDLTMIKTKPAKKKEPVEDGHLTKKALEKRMKVLAKIAAKAQAAENEMQDTEEVLEEEEQIHIPESKAEEEEEKVNPVLRCPSPSRSRQSSPNKKEGSPKKEGEKQSTTLKPTAFEFVPGLNPPPQAISSLQANAAEFVPPGFNLKASASEFVPPGFEPKVAEAPCTTLEPPTSDSSSQPVWSHAVFTPSASLEATKQQQPAQKVTVPALALPALALNKCEPSIDSTSGTGETGAAIGEDSCDSTEKWSARIHPSDILGKVKQSLTAKLGRMVPNSMSTKDPCIGKVHEKVKKIEEMEAENEAEKQREAAIKVINDAKQAEKQAIEKEKQREMDETMVQCFLQAVTTHVKDRDLPMMGTTLYGKHMRSSRRVGASCDVKDSSFVWLRPFLEKLEDDGLIKLKPEIKDPTVIWIDRSHQLIKKWKPWAYSETVGYKKGVGRR